MIRLGITVVAAITLGFVATCCALFSDQLRPNPKE